MFEQNVIKTRGFRMLDAAELEVVSGGQEEENEIVVTGSTPDDLWIDSISPGDLALFGNFMLGVDFNLSSTLGTYGPPADSGTAPPDPDVDYGLPDAEPPEVPPSEIQEIIDNVANIVSVEDDYFLFEFNDGSRVGFNLDGGIRFIHPF